MTRTRTVFFCTECGNETPRWQGQCPACSAWNTLAEEPRRAGSRQGSAARGAARGGRGGRYGGPRVSGDSGAGHLAAGPAGPARLADAPDDDGARWSSGLDELDFVLGGGVVPGSVVLLGGEPGIGKSTLLLQVAARLEASGHAALYVSGEESAAQVRMRAERLGEPAAGILFLGETDVEVLLDATAASPPAVLFVDSIQTMYSPDVEGAPGSVGQVRECAARLQRYAKDEGVVVFLVGHVTKGGVVAGPRTLEHIVDTVLYFEATGGLDHRILRATKNRFGAADEIGVFRMTAAGLEPVAHPSELFLGQRAGGVSGSAVAATLEGSRPLLVEVQALCTRTSYGGSPQRAATGLDRQRLALLLAVLEKRAGIGFGLLDVFVNVVGGVRLGEPAADLATVAALLSSVRDRPVPERAVFLGEIGLAGEVRAVGQLERRLGEAARLGFAQAFLPAGALPARPAAGLEPVPVRDVRELAARLFP
jgi:DNA repair protein RadA/Sms